MGAKYQKGRNKGDASAWHGRREVTSYESGFHQHPFPLSGNKAATKLFDYPGAPDVVPGRLFGALRGTRVPVIQTRDESLAARRDAFGWPYPVRRAVPIDWGVPPTTA